jgi:uncharacterized membrane protein (DUF106 family)
MAEAQQEDSPGFQGATIIMMMLVLFIILNPGLRLALGSALGVVFDPLIGFDGKYPVMTLLCAGLIMTVFTTLVRHRFTKWTDMAKSQHRMKHFNKEFKEARISGNQLKINKLTEVQKSLMKEQMATSNTQMKLMPITMIVVIPIFGWIWVYIAGSLINTSFSAPWAFNVSLLGRGPFLGIMPLWIFVYSLISIPVGQMFQKTLKYVEFKKRLEDLECEEEEGDDEE